jgi:hypothetical protein
MQTSEAAEHLARQLVFLNAPEELPFFDQMKLQLPETDPDDDDAFGFGLGQVVYSITPVAMVMGGVAMDFIVKKMSEAGAEVLQEKFKGWLRGKFAGKPQLTSHLTPPQKEALLNALLSTALASGVSAEQAVKLSADFIAVMD